MLGSEYVHLGRTRNAVVEGHPDEIFEGNCGVSRRHRDVVMGCEPSCPSLHESMGLETCGSSCVHGAQERSMVGRLRQNKCQYRRSAMGSK